MTTTATTNTLAPITIAAEKALFGQPDTSSTSLGTADTLVSIQPVVAGKVNRVKRITCGYSAAPATHLLTVADGATTIWQAQIGTLHTLIDLDFSLHPLRGSSGAAVTVSCGSAGGTVVQTLSVIGDTVAAP